MVSANPSTSPAGAPPASILLVDDAPANLLVLEAILEPLGVRLVRAASGEMALRLLAQEDFAAVLLDVQMPTLDGFATAKLLRNQPRSRLTPIIFLTADEADRFPVVEAYKLGAVDYLIKPLVPEILQAKVAVFVELFRRTQIAQRQLEELRARDQRDLAREGMEKALRESEARYRELFENAHDIIYTLDLQGRLTSVNKRAEQVFGYSQAECLGRNVGELVAPEHHAAMCAAREQKLAGAAAPTVYELEVIARDGRRVPLEVSSRLILQDSRPVGIQGIARDVSEGRRAREALQEAARRKDEFLAMLAHELRNPLAPLRNALHILRLCGGDWKTVEQARAMMDRQVTYLARIVDDLLDVSRITRGKVNLRKERLDLAQFARVGGEDHRPSFQSRDVALDIRVPSLPAWISGDATRLAQILDNLLANALKFTNQGGQVSCEVEVDHAQGQALLRVRDTGVGIDPHVMAHLFEPFTQADQSLDRGPGGLGLGLAIVKGLAELHGGSVAVESAGLGAGATFTVRLPLEKEPPALGHMPPLSLLPAAQVLRVLIIEDNHDAADSLRMLLGMFGYDVRVAYTGLEGLEAARLFRPEVVVCDIGLPGMDGFAVALALRKEANTPAVRLIALTGYGRDEDKVRAREAGFDLHLTKPVDPQHLVQQIMKI